MTRTDSSPSPGVADAAGATNSRTDAAKAIDHNSRGESARTARPYPWLALKVN